MGGTAVATGLAGGATAGEGAGLELGPAADTGSGPSKADARSTA